MIVAGERIAIRPMTPDDRNFVLSTWIISEKEYYKRDGIKKYRLPVIEDHVKFDRVLVACSEDDPGVLYAWLCFLNSRNLVYGYVSRDLRKSGLFKALKAEAGVI